MEVNQLGEKLAEPGKQLKLTVDIDLQIAAEQALEGKNGAIVAMDPRNGEILAMVSRPTFDPNDFAVHISREEWTKLVTDENHPLLNKGDPGATGMRARCSSSLWPRPVCRKVSPKTCTSSVTEVQRLWPVLQMLDQRATQRSRRGGNQ